MPHTSIDGQIIDNDSVVDEVNRMAGKQNERWINSDLELPKKAKNRFEKLSS